MAICLVPKNHCFVALNCLALIIFVYEILFINSTSVSKSYKIITLEKEKDKLAKSSVKYKAIISHLENKLTNKYEELYPMNKSYCKNETLFTRSYVPNCQKLVGGDIREQISARRFVKSCVRVVPSSEDYINMTENCEMFRMYRKYIAQSLKEEQNFPIAFSIMMYKDVNQAERLLRSIYRPHNYYCIHVDRKADSKVHSAMERIARCLTNVRMASVSVNVVWGKYSVLESELVCMKDLLREKRWEYFINLTGQEYPLKTNLQIVKILKALRGANSVDASTERKWRARWRKAGEPPHGIHPVKGNIHVAVNREFVQFAIYNNISVDFLKWLRRTTIPDETFFNTLSHNPHLHIAGSYKGGNMTTNWDTKPYIARFKNWGKQSANKYFRYPCGGKRVRGICIFGIRDLPRLTSRVELFANKLHWNYQATTLDCLEEWHRNMVETEYTSHGQTKFDTSYYENMPYLKEIV